MPQFFNVLPPDDALRALHDRGVSRVETERLPTPDAVGRVTGAAIVSPEDLPAFPRSAMDGYSVRAADTFGASESLPAYFDVVGEVAMGRPPEVSLLDGQAAVAFTGGMLADGADAVVMVEHTQQLDDSRSRSCDRSPPARTSSSQGRTRAPERRSCHPGICCGPRT